ncbi:hypothetical protein MAP00_004827 [Monascus purpureus]|nr:hypothetical protein MAP00_004827 [Monascus purpureus]
MTRTILPFHHTPPLPQTSGQRSSYPELDWEEEQVKEFLCIFVKDRSTRNGEHRVCGTTARKLYQGDIEDLKIYVGDDETIAKCLYRELQLYSKYAVTKHTWLYTDLVMVISLIIILSSNVIKSKLLGLGIWTACVVVYVGAIVACYEKNCIAKHLPEFLVYREWFTPHILRMFSVIYNLLPISLSCPADDGP